MQTTESFRAAAIAGGGARRAAWWAVVAVVSGLHPAVDAADEPRRDAEPVAAAVPAAEAPPDRHPALKRLSPTDEIWLDAARKELVVGGEVALVKGEIEVFACPKLSKEHEAVVATRCPARLVHAGLLAIGLEPGQPVSFDPEYRPARGPKRPRAWHGPPGRQPWRRPAVAPTRLFPRSSRRGPAWPARRAS